MLLHPWYSVAIVIIAMSAVCMLPYYVLSRVRRRPFSTDTVEMAVNVGFRIGTLHALILALIFSGTQDQYQKARETVTAEVIILSEVAYEIAEMRDEELYSTVSKLERYVDALQEDDAPAIDVRNIRSSDLIFRKASQLSNEIYNELLSIEPDEEQQKITLNRIISKLDEAFTLRLERLASAAQGISVLFWILAIVGFVFVLLLFFVVPFSWLNATFIAFYGCYTGLILFFIVEMNNPYIGISSIDLRLLGEAFGTIEESTQ